MIETSAHAAQCPRCSIWTLGQMTHISATVQILSVVNMVLSMLLTAHRLNDVGVPASCKEVQTPVMGKMGVASLQLYLNPLLHLKILKI
ncbi:hypothetical protein TNCV_2341441 [Trichonephila clavipes]|nr:hypothetical protein TNCV_2341441 [Trichonephila clavipes]